MRAGSFRCGATCFLQTVPVAEGMDLDWTSLEELRASYLAGTAGVADYWTSDRLLGAYDATFARRIAWKWAYVFAELDRRNWSPPEGRVLDYGCGTGVGVREFLQRYSAAGRVVELRDRSSRALRYAATKVRAEFPLTVVEAVPSGVAPAVLIVSHVLSELDDAGMAELLALAASAQCVLFLEPGTKADSAKLVALREKLREKMHAVAPCLHSEACGMLAEERGRDWCHFFADPPGEIFQDGDWMYFGKQMGIDLRALPLSYLVLDATAPTVRPPEDVVRVVGSARLLKAHAMLLGCSACGVRECRLQKRADPGFFREVSKRRAHDLQRWSLEGAEILKISHAE